MNITSRESPGLWFGPAARGSAPKGWMTVMVAKHREMDLEKCLGGRDAEGRLHLPCR
jgi:hypothetical protein